MAFQPGPIPVIAVNPAFSADTTSNFTLDQVYSGLGQNFMAGQGQTFQGGLSNSAVNVGLSQNLGRAVGLASGLNLFNGQGPVASSITSLVPTSLSGNVNSSIGNSFGSAGNFASILQGGSNPNTLTNSATSFLGSTAGQLWGLLQFPGGTGEGEAPANHGGSHYGLGFGGADVTFSLARANRGPQEYGSALASNIPNIGNAIGTDQYTSGIPNFSSPAFSAATQAKVTTMFDKSTTLYKPPGKAIPGNVGFPNVNIQNQYSY